MGAENYWGKRIKGMRDSLELSQQALGALLGFSIMSINRWEKGHPTPDRYGALVLQLTLNALKHHSPVAVLMALRSAGPEPLALVRALTWLERHPSRSPVPPSVFTGRPPASVRAPSSMREPLSTREPPPSSLQ